MSSGFAEMDLGQTGAYPWNGESGAVTEEVVAVLREREEEEEETMTMSQLSAEKDRNKEERRKKKKKWLEGG